MQQLLRYLFSLLCVVALSSVGALRAADVVAAAPSSESPALVAPSEVSISLRGNQLRVTNADGQTVEVYNITGVKVFVHRVEGDDRTFTLSAERGIYIVKVGKVVRRVTLLGGASLLSVAGCAARDARSPVAECVATGLRGAKLCIFFLIEYGIPDARYIRSRD